MADGESGGELPPVVVTVEGDDSPLLEMFAQDVEAARTRGEDIAAALTEGAAAGSEGAAAEIEAAAARLAEAQAQLSAAMAAGRDEEAQALIAANRDLIDQAMAEAPAEARAAGEEAGAAMVEGAAAATESAFPTLAERMRAGYDTAFAEMQDGTRAFTDAQLETFRTYYTALAAQGDDSAAAMLEQVRALAGETVTTAQDTAAASADAADGAAASIARLSDDEIAQMNAQWDAASAAAAAEADVAVGAQAAAAAVREVISAIEQEAAAARAADAAFTEAAPALAAIRQQIADINRESGTQQFFPGPGEVQPGQWEGSQAEANAARVRASLEGEASAAQGARGAMGGLAGVMNGPLMQAFWGISAVAYLPMMFSQFGQMFGSSGQAAAQAAQQIQQLGAAVAQDGNMIGANTEAALANQLAYQGLGDQLQRYGVSLTQATEYAAGVTSVQQAVTQSLDSQAAAAQRVADYMSHSTLGPGSNTSTVEGIRAQQIKEEQQALEDLAASAQKAVDKQNQITEATLATEKATGVFTSQVTAAKLAMDQNAESAAVNAAATLEWLGEVTPGTDKYTQAVWEQLTAYKAQAQQADIAAAAQQQYLAWLVPGTEQYTNAVRDQVVALEMSANQAKIAADAQRLYLQDFQAYTPAFQNAVSVQQASALQSASAAGIAAVAALNLDANQTQLIGALYGSVDAYQRATDGANGYKTVLTDLNGTQMGLDQAQNTLAQDMLNAQKSFAANSYSLDLNTASGVANRQALVNASQAIIAMGVAQYQSDGDMNHANQTIQQQIAAYVQATGATGKAKDAITLYLEEITKIPPDVSTTFHANTDQAMQAISLLGQFAMSEIDSINNTPIVPQLNTSSNNFGGPRAQGGPVTAGHLYTVGEKGVPEWFVPGADGYITPADMLAPSLAAAGPPGAGGVGSPPVVNVHVYLDGRELTPSVRTDAQWYKRRNSITGMT